MGIEVESEYRKLVEGCAILPDIGVGLVELRGADTLDWLQGQATNDLRGVSDSNPISFCLCEATGQLLAICDVWKCDDRLLIATDNVEALLSRAESMVILEDVQGRNLSEDLELVSIQGRKSGSQVETFQNAIVFQNPRVSEIGFDIWLPRGQDKTERMSSTCFDVARLEAGVPLRNVDYKSKTLPPELGPAFERKHISYSKGCYTGQEVLMRIHSRGHTNKTWVGLLLDAPVAVGAKVSHSSREDAGVITSAVVSPRFGAIAAATLRNEAAQEGENVTVQGIRGTVRHMPIRRD